MHTQNPTQDPAKDPAKDQDSAAPILSFVEFSVLWNQTMGQRTPRLHINMARWLEKAWENGETRLLLMAFRSAGKSTLVGLFAAWLLYRNPNLRIMVLAADGTLAGKMVRNVKRIIERHPCTAGVLKPRSPDQWASERFTVQRDMELRDPSMIGRGVSSNITGSRADIVICDDVEVPLTSDSAEKREALRERLNEMNYVLVAGGMQLYMGTPHHFYSIYADEPRYEIGEEEIFLSGFKRLCIPVLGNDGQSAWPERYDAETIAQIRRATGPNKFDSQMMLKFINILEGRLDADMLQFYNGEIDPCPVRKALYIGSIQMATACCWWDPSLAKNSGDNSVAAIVYSDPGGNYYLHHVEYIKVNENDETANAVQQIETIIKLLKKYHIPMLGVETNGIGGFLPGMVQTALKKAGGMTSLVPEPSKKSKDVRIIEAFDPLLAAKRLYVHERVRQTPFIMEMREWRPERSRCRDDALDAVSGAIMRMPDRLREGFARKKGHYDWMNARGQHKARGEFEV